MDGRRDAPTDVAALLDAPAPRCSDAERVRRRAAVLGLLDAHDLDAAVVYGAHRAGTAVGWLTGWPTSREAALVLDRTGPDRLFVQFRNHVPQARGHSHDDVEVAWGDASTVTTVLAELAARGHDRIGTIGPLGYRDGARLGAAVLTQVPLDADYTRLRLVKSAEEITWLRAGAWLSDVGLAALADALKPGVSEHEVLARAQHAYTALGGTTHICYLMSTPMDDPRRCVPGQLPTGRALAAGDVVVVELSAAFDGYAGQVLRTFTLEASLSRLHRRLHDVAEAARDAVLAVVRDGTTPAQLRDATGLIEDAGLATCDDVVHGFGGGYLPPVIASRGHAEAPLPDQPLRAGMTIVVQPNVVTPDRRAGVQTGELVLVTTDGYERLHTTPPGVLTAGPGAPAVST